MTDDIHYQVTYEGQPNITIDIKVNGYHHYTHEGVLSLTGDIADEIMLALHKVEPMKAPLHEIKVERIL